MDAFSRTFLPVAAAAGVTGATVSRHIPVIRSCVEPGDAPVLVVRGVRPERLLSPEFLLVLTRRRLVVTRRSRLLRPLGLHLNAELRHLANVSWSPNADGSVVEFAATAMDGVRERFQLKIDGPEQLRRLDEALGAAFTARTRTVKPEPRRAPVLMPAAAF